MPESTAPAEPCALCQRTYVAIEPATLAGETFWVCVDHVSCIQLCTDSIAGETYRHGKRWRQLELDLRPEGGR